MIERYLAQASTYAADVDGIINLIGVLVTFWAILTFIVFFYFIFKFRANGAAKAEWVTGEEKSQKRWITIPHILVLVCDVFILIGAVRVWYDVKLTMPEDTTPVRIVAQQWAWTFQHAGPDGELDTADDITKIDELHVQKDVTYQYLLEATDVMHDFSVPVWRLKQDAIPGRVIRGWFTPTLVGEFDVQCAEMCGIGHGLMPARVFVESAEQHTAWMAEHSSQPVAATGPVRTIAAAADATRGE